MAVREIKIYPDPILRKKCSRIPAADAKIRQLATDMVETLEAEGGAGLAAPQVGVSLRLIVLGMPDEEERYILMNPQVVKRKGERIVNEGCLSIPGYIGEIKRAEEVTVKAQTLDGKEVRMKADGLFGEALEHEIDHLDGILYIDHLESDDKLRRLDALDAEF